jgi:hypothetical protein
MTTLTRRLLWLVLRTFCETDGYFVLGWYFSIESPHPRRPLPVDTSLLSLVNTLSFPLFSSAGNQRRSSVISTTTTNPSLAGAEIMGIHGNSSLFSDPDNPGIDFSDDTTMWPYSDLELTLALPRKPREGSGPMDGEKQHTCREPRARDEDEDEIVSVHDNRHWDRKVELL